MNRQRRYVLGVSLGLLLAAVPVLAHHSITSEFDPSKEGVVKGVMSGVQWVNPHVYTFVDVKDPKTGKVDTWSFEGNPPATYHRAGLRRSDWKVGEEVTVTYAAAKDGTKHLGFVKMIRYNDGHTMVFRVGGE